MMKKIILILLVCIACASCKKYLDKTPNIALTIPTTISDFQNLVDQDILYQGANGLGLIGCDDYYVTNTTWLAQTAPGATGYNWQKDIFQGKSSFDWNAGYKNIYNTNVILEGLNTVPITTANQSQWNSIKATALFYRAFAFFDLEEVFGKPYSKSGASTDLGIPLRLNSDLSAISTRATVQAAYDQVLTDLKQSLNLAPTSIPVANRNRVSKPSAYGMLARVYLQMQDYTNAGLYADSSLKLYNTLIDYNTLSSTASFPFAYPANDEVSLQAWRPAYTIYTNTTPIVDSVVYSSYSSNDLRKIIFFAKNATTGNMYFKGSYTAQAYPFAGIGTDEMLLIRAECYARAGNTSAAMSDLNTLLIKRWKTGTFTPYTASTSTDALTQVLKERRKELIFRGLRWIDLRRLNQDPNFAISLTRVLNGLTYTLPPNDQRYTYPIPDNEIQSSGLQQNQR